MPVPQPDGDPTGVYVSSVCPGSYPERASAGMARSGRREEPDAHRAENGRNQQPGAPLRVARPADGAGNQERGPENGEGVSGEHRTTPAVPKTVSDNSPSACRREPGSRTDRIPADLPAFQAGDPPGVWRFGRSETDAPAPSPCLQATSPATIVSRDRFESTGATRRSELPCRTNAEHRCCNWGDGLPKPPAPIAP